MAGMVAIGEAARYPAALSKLVLIVTAAQWRIGFIDRARRSCGERGKAEQQRLCTAVGG